jgi:hypothetical protein
MARARMVFPRCVAAGLGQCLALPGLAAVLWLVNLSLASLAALPAWTAWREGFAFSPEADSLLTAFHPGVFVELGQRGGGLIVPLLGLGALALVLNALTTGGVIESLLAADDRPLLHRFGRGAGRFFWRFVRVGLVTGLVGALGVGIAVAVFALLTRPLQDSPWEPRAPVLSLVHMALGLGVAMVALMALDFARVRIVREDSRRPVRELRKALWLVLRNPVKVALLWASLALIYVVLLVAHFAVGWGSLARTTALILAMVVAQQALMLVRAGLRVALFAGCAEMDAILRPAPALAEPAAATADGPEPSPQLPPPAPPAAPEDGATGDAAPGGADTPSSRSESTPGNRPERTGATRARMGHAAARGA